MKKKTLAFTLVGLLLVGLLAVQLGAYNVAANDHHWRLTQTLIDWARERSIEARSEDIHAPDLNDDDLIARGAGEYDEMCTGCHLKPGEQSTELAQGLYPYAPVFYKFRGNIDEEEYAELFWVIKNGLKMTGMPAWGLAHDDQSIWSMAAFVGKLPGMTPTQYARWLARGKNREQEDSRGEQDGDEDHENPDSAAQDEVEGGPLAALSAFHQALSSGDISSARALLSPDLWVVEGGHVQRSREAYASEHLLADVAFLKGMHRERLESHLQQEGNLAWVVTRTRTSGTYQGKNIDSTGVETATLRRRGTSWQIEHLHWSH